MVFLCNTQAKSAKYWVLPFQFCLYVLLENGELWGQLMTEKSWVQISTFSTACSFIFNLYAVLTRLPSTMFPTASGLSSSPTVAKEATLSRQTAAARSNLEPQSRSRLRPEPPGINFSNILREAFKHLDSKSAKKTESLTVFFA